LTVGAILRFVPSTLTGIASGIHSSTIVDVDDTRIVSIERIIPWAIVRAIIPWTIISIIPRVVITVISIIAAIPWVVPSIVHPWTIPSIIHRVNPWVVPTSIIERIVESTIIAAGIPIARTPIVWTPSVIVVEPRIVESVPSTHRTSVLVFCYLIDDLLSRGGIDIKGVGTHTSIEGNDTYDIGIALDLLDTSSKILSESVVLVNTSITTRPIVICFAICVLWSHGHDLRLLGYEIHVVILSHQR
jgi:hypothetical protein